MRHHNRLSAQIKCDLAALFGAIDQLCLLFVAAEQLKQLQVDDLRIKLHLLGIMHEFLCLFDDFSFTSLTGL